MSLKREALAVAAAAERAAQLESVATVKKALARVIRRERGGGAEGAVDDDDDDVPPLLMFGAALAAMESQGKTHGAELLYILGQSLPDVPPAVLYPRFEVVSACLLSALKALDGKAGVGKEFVLEPVIQSIGWLLASVPAKKTEWTPEKILMAQYTLTFIVDNRDEVRRWATDAITRVLYRLHQAKSDVLSETVQTYCVPILAAKTPKQTAQAASVLEFVKQALPLLSTHAVIAITEALVRLTNLSAAKLNTLSLAALTNLIKSPIARVKVGFLRDLTAAIVKRPPSLDDTASCGEYVGLVAACMARLLSAEMAKLPVVRGGAGGGSGAGAGAGAGAPLTPAAAPLVPSIATLLPDALLSIIGCFEAKAAKVHKAAAGAIGSVLFTCVTKPVVADTVAVIAAAGDRYRPTKTPLELAMAAMETILQYRFQASWTTSIPVLALPFRLLGPSASFPMLKELVSSLDALRTMHLEEEDPDHRLEDEDDYSRPKATRKQIVQRQVRAVLGAALRAIGIENFLSVLPLTSGADGLGIVAGGRIQEDRKWLLKLIRRHLRFTRCPLQYFTRVILAHVKSCDAAASAAAAAGHAKTAKTLRALSTQLWALFPSFCACPTDVPTAFNDDLCRQLAGAMTAATPETAHLPTIVFGGLKVLIQRNKIAAGIVDESPGFDDGMDADTAATRTIGMTSMASSRRSGARAGAEKFSVFNETFANFTKAGSTVFGDDSDDEDDEDGDGDDDEEGGGGGGGGGRGRGMGVEGVNLPSAMPSIPEAAAKANLAAIAKFSDKFVPVLFGQYEKLAASPSAVQNPTKPRRALEVVSLFLTISEPKLVGRFFEAMGQRLRPALAALHEAIAAAGGPKAAAAAAAKASGAMDTEEGGASAAVIPASVKASRTVGALLGLTQAMIPVLPDAALGRLYRVLTPIIRDDRSVAAQKKAYKVLVSLIKCHPEFALDPTRRDEVLGLLLESLPTCSAGSKKSRLQCLRTLVHTLDLTKPDHQGIIPAILGEVMLCAKDSSRRARTASFDLLLVMANKMYEGGAGALTSTRAGFEQSLGFFIRLILAAVTSDRSALRSAAMVTLARIVYEYSAEDVIAAMLPKLMPSVLLLFRDTSKEVVKSAIVFLRVTVAAMTVMQLEPFLADICKALFVWSGANKAKLRVKVRLIMQRLVNKFGPEAILPLVPKEDAALVQHISRQKRRAVVRKKNRAAARASNSGFEQLAGEDFVALHENDEREIEDSTRAATTKARLRAVRGAGAGAGAGAGNGGDGGEEPIFIDLDADDDDDDGERSDDEDSDDEIVGKTARKRNKVSAAATGKEKTTKHGRDVRGAKAVRRAAAKQDSGRGGGSKTKKKGAGDAKRKGDKFEPYSYIPLDARAASGKGGKMHVDKFSRLVGGKGSKRRR